MDKTEILLKELTESHGVPGYETDIREVIRKYMKPLGGISKDNMGSLICRKPGSSAEPKVMLAGHMDEIGFMVKHISSDGFIRFTTLGGWWDHVLLGQRVIIKTNKGDVIGVIGAKPPHLLSGRAYEAPSEKKYVHRHRLDFGKGGRKSRRARGRSDRPRERVFNSG